MGFLYHSGVVTIRVMGDTQLRVLGISTVSSQAANHSQKHLERSERREGMRLICGQEDRFARFDLIGLVRNRDFRFSVEHLNKRIKRGGVLRQALAGVEGEHSHRAGRMLDAACG